MSSSTRQQGAPPMSTTGATLAGIGVGVASFAVVIIVGILFAQWSVSEFFANLSPTMLGEFAVMVSLVILTFGLPVAAYLRFRLRAPGVTLVAITLLWVALAFAQGFGQSGVQDLFALAAYALWLAPVYVVAYLGLGGIEHYLRDSPASP